MRVTGLAAVGVVVVVVGCGSPDTSPSTQTPASKMASWIDDRVGWVKEEGGEKSGAAKDYVKAREEGSNEKINAGKTKASETTVAGKKKTMATKRLTGQAANDAREYLYHRGLCEARHGDNCDDNSRNGNDGAPGRNGNDGQAGPSGAAGAVGASGAAGKDGLDGTAGAPGKDGAAGADGAPGTQGEAGEQGEQGEQGVAGNDGTPGQDGNSCELIQVLKSYNGNSGKCKYDIYLSCDVGGSVKIADDYQKLCNN